VKLADVPQIPSAWQFAGCVLSRFLSNKESWIGEKWIAIDPIFG